MTTNKDAIIEKIKRSIQSKHATSFFINGAPGSGKSRLLQNLAKQLPSQVSRCLTLGPYELSPKTEYLAVVNMLTDLVNMGFIEALPTNPQLFNLIDVWQRVVSAIEDYSSGRTFIVLFDLSHIDMFPLSFICRLFSDMRYFEGTWTVDRLRVHHIVAGFWDQHALYEYYNQSNVSFPYTVGYNYEVWDGLTNEEIADLVRQKVGDVNPLYSRLLYELAGGYPAVVLEILHYITVENLSLPELLVATQKAATKGVLQKRLVSIWGTLPDNVKELLRDLIIRRHLSTHLPRTIIDFLFVSGLVYQEQVGTEIYLGFRSWYIELVVRLHVTELRLTDARIYKIQTNELVPPVTTLNAEAYQLIHDIENAARNFVAIQLSLNQEGDDHILKGKNPKIVDGQYEDQYQRAIDWQARSNRRGLSTELNPLLTYCSTSELANLIRKIGIEIGSQPWQDVAQSISNLVPVRDAVMHNQLITGEDLQKIYELRNSIYDALSKLK